MNEDFRTIDYTELVSLLRSPEIAGKDLLLRARERTQAVFSRNVLLRGIVEFSSCCRNSCTYCGLRLQNTGLRRHRLGEDEICSAAEDLYQIGLRTLVLQSGEDLFFTGEMIARLIDRIKASCPGLAVTLSLGERDYSDYRLWREAGADRYLLKIETRDPELYHRLHPGMSLERRLDCIDSLIELSYQTGSGLINGLPGQTPESLARDLLYLRSKSLAMISIGPLVPHPATPLSTSPPGSISETLFLLALCRLMNPDAHIPATSALASGQEDLRSSALEAGANVIMPNCTPADAARAYDIYPHSHRRENLSGSALKRAVMQVQNAGMLTDFSRGDALGFNRTAEKEYRL